MASESEALPPLMWVSGQDRNNVVVLTADILFLATVKKADLPRIDLGLEDGEPATELLPAKAWKVPLADVTRIELKQVRSKSMFEEWMNKDVTVYYLDGTKRRYLKISLASESVRDEVVQSLNDRVGGWSVSEADLSAWLILARYLWIITVLALLTIGWCWLVLTRPLNEGALFKDYLDQTGAWGIAVPGMFVCIGVLLLGIWQLRTPPIAVTYKPDKER
jgi:hypothetical protein